MRKLILAVMLICAVFASGCGADNAAKDAQQKVDKAADDAAKMKNEAQQTLDKATDDANKKAEQISNEVDKKIEDVSNEAQKAMDNAAAGAENMKNVAVQRIQDVKQKMTQVAGNITEIDAARMAVGGILVGATKDDVRRIYGEPNKIDSANVSEGAIDTWYYGDSLEIEFLNDNVYSVASTKANGLATPDGVTVGTSKNALIEKYGSSAGNDVIFYTTPNRSTGIGFGVENDKVSSIEIYAQ